MLCFPCFLKYFRLSSWTVRPYFYSFNYHYDSSHAFYSGHVCGNFQPYPASLSLEIVPPYEVIPRTLDCTSADPDTSSEYWSKGSVTPPLSHRPRTWLCPTGRNRRLRIYFGREKSWRKEGTHSHYLLRGLELNEYLWGWVYAAGGWNSR